MIDLPTIQKKLNLHYTLSLDLFGQEVSTNAANAFNSGIKGRYMESRIEDDHRLTNDSYKVWDIENGQLVQRSVPALTAINMRLRDDYTRDASGGVGRWNKIIEKARGQIRAEAAARGVQPQDRRVREQADQPRGQVHQRRTYDRGLRIGCRPTPTASSSSR